jgi:hypothetical protein
MLRPRRRQTERQLSADHEGFLRYKHFRWAKRAGAFAALAVLVYALTDQQPRANGGTWLGYTLGSVGVLLILWLSALGLRKRTMTRGNWSLKAWTSAHVYLGLALIVIATLHSGFQFGWNVHTLAWALMVLVILSGVFGVVAYSVLPEWLSTNREQMTQPQLLEALTAVDRQLDVAAQPLGREHTKAVISALKEHPERDGLLRRLIASNRSGPTQQAIDALNRAGTATAANPALLKVEALLQRRQAQLARMRQHMRYKSLLEVWLTIHVPATFALIAALAAHVVSVFFYW